MSMNRYCRHCGLILYWTSSGWTHAHKLVYNHKTEEEAPVFLSCGNWELHAAHPDCLGVDQESALRTFMRGET